MKLLHRMVHPRWAVVDMRHWVVLPVVIPDMLFYTRKSAAENARTMNELTWQQGSPSLIYKIIDLRDFV